MEEITVNRLSYDRLIAAFDLIKYKASNGYGLSKNDVNEALTVAGMETIAETAQKSEVI